MVPLDEVEKVLTQSDLVNRDVSPHIMLKSLVRVLWGPYQHFWSVVAEKSNHGRELIIMDLDNNKNVSLPIQVFQDPSRALMTQPCP